jgi:uncharacterized protein
MSTLTKSFKAIHEAIQNAPVIDAHDHIWPMNRFESPMTVSSLFKHSYLAWSMRLSDGSPNGMAIRPAPAFEDNSWEALQAIIKKVNLSSFYWTLLRGLAELYELPGNELTKDSWEKLSLKLEENYRNPAWMSQVLDRANIKAVIYDLHFEPGNWETPEPRLFPSLKISSSLAAFHPEALDFEGYNLIRDWASYFDIWVDSLKDLEDLIEKVLDKNIQAGAHSLKSPIAYERSLAIGPGSREKASQIFGTPEDRISLEDRLAFGDYIIRYYLEQARERNLVFQVHTGMARLNDSNPMLLTTVLGQYPDVIFDLFHGGYPWMHEIGGLAKNYPNVRLNLAWLPQISIDAAVSTLKEWLQVIPQNDRIVWGGDCWTMEEMFGALLAGKHVIARALADFADEGYIGIDDAILTARNILFQNGIDIYHLESGQHKLVNTA